jgi:SAM-dependent methyltransferase
MVDSEFEAMLASDERHWWYRGRRRVLRAVLSRLGLPGNARLLDAGCGSGRMLDELAAYGRVTGVDASRAAVAVARGRGHDVVVAKVERLPFASSRFDLVTCLDVVEHTPDDRRTLSELRRVTRPGGRLLVTVPAYPSLWSAHDEVNHHYRRYRRRSLLDAARDAGWTPVTSTHFNTLLLPPEALVRLAARRRPAGARRSDLERTPAWLDGVLELPMRVEAALVGRGVCLPAGLSLLALLRNEAPLALPYALRRPGSGRRADPARSLRPAA